MIKTLSKVGVKGAFLNIIKAIYERPTANIILNGQKLRAFPLRSGTRQGCPLSPPPIQHSIGSLSHSNQTRKRNKRHPNWKGGNETVIVCRWHDNVHRKSYRLYQKTTRPNKWIGKTEGFEVNIQKSKAFLCTNNETSETEIREKIPFDIATRKIK